jgi:hypothetical protein
MRWETAEVWRVAAGSLVGEEAACRVEGSTNGTPRDEELRRDKEEEVASRGDYVDDDARRTGQR